MENVKDFKLPKVFAEKWLIALRSGVYSQGREMLYNKEEDSYCCIGVAGHICQISKRSMNEKGIFAGEHFKLSTLKKYIKLGLPVELTANNNVDSLTNALASMNDDGNTFEEIADWVIENVEFYEE